MSHIINMEDDGEWGQYEDIDIYTENTSYNVGKQIAYNKYLDEYEFMIDHNLIDNINYKPMNNTSIYFHPICFIIKIIIYWFI